MILILRSKRFKTSIALFTFGLALSSCSNFKRVNAACGKDVYGDPIHNFDIFYNPNHYQQLIKTKDCVNCEINGTNVDLSNLDLTGADLSGAQLAGANLSGTKLTNADLSRVILYDYDGGFFGSGVTCIANLEGVDLRGANLEGANLSVIDLTGLNFDGVNFEQAYLSRANLNSANLSNLNLNSVRLSRADLSQANLTGAIYSRADTLDKETTENPNTIFPQGFDPIKAGMIRIE